MNALVLFLLPQFLKNLLADSFDFPYGVLREAAVIQSKGPLDLVYLIDLFLVLPLILVDLDL